MKLDLIIASSRQVTASFFLVLYHTQSL